MDRRIFLKAVGASGLSIGLSGLIGCSQQLSLPKKKPNILFIAVDDLRPELGCYGQKIVHSPNIDRIAKEGVRFNRAYCQEAICGPSRASLLTGRRPDNIGVIENNTYFRNTVPDVTTLPAHFANHGYTTVGIGKIYHDRQDDKLSWNRKAAAPQRPKPYPVMGYQSPETLEYFKVKHKEIREKYGDFFIYSLGSGPAWEACDIPDNMYEDGYYADQAVASLKEIKDNPFFLAVGFRKPHLPFIAPKKYWNLYNPTDIDLADNPFAPKDAPSMGLHASFELRTRKGIPKKGDISDDQARKLIHAYLACVSYVDAQIGKILDELDALGLRDSTIIMLWGDHGWHLGEHGIWGKATNYEIATRVPLIVSAPGRSRNVATDALVELVDMYPTLSELAHLPLPKHLDGKSFVPVLKNPNRSWKKAAFSQFPCPALREWAANPLSDEMRTTFFGPLIAELENKMAAENPTRFDKDIYENHLMGYTMRTDRYRLVLWVDYRYPRKEPYGVELYDLKTDPDENTNLSKLPKYAVLVGRLTKHLRDHLRKGNEQIDNILKKCAKLS
jgi:arylsulfatase A-like enzyme